MRCKHGLHSSCGSAKRSLTQLPLTTAARDTQQHGQASKALEIQRPWYERSVKLRTDWPSQHDIDPADPISLPTERGSTPGTPQASTDEIPDMSFRGLRNVNPHPQARHTGTWPEPMQPCNDGCAAQIRGLDGGYH